MSKTQKQEWKYYAGAPFENSPPASELPMPPAWLLSRHPNVLQQQQTIPATTPTPRPTVINPILNHPQQRSQHIFARGTAAGVGHGTRILSNILSEAKDRSLA